MDSLYYATPGAGPSTFSAPSSHSESPRAAPNPPTRREPGRRRSRAGCLVCRSRRIKCDMRPGECENCTRYCAECVWPEKTKLTAGDIQDRLDRRHSKQTTSNPSEILDTAEMEPYSRPNKRTRASSPVSSFNQFSAGPSRPANVPIVQELEAGGSARMLGVPITPIFAGRTAMSQFFSQPTTPPDFLRKFVDSDEDAEVLHHALVYSLSLATVHEDSNIWKTDIVPLFLNASELASNTTAPMIDPSLENTPATGPAPTLSSFQQLATDDLSQMLTLDSIFLSWFGPNGFEDNSFAAPLIGDLSELAQRQAWTGEVTPGSSTLASVPLSTSTEASKGKARPRLSIMALKESMLYLGASHLGHLRRADVKRKDTVPGLLAKAQRHRQACLDLLRLALQITDELASDEFLAAVQTYAAAEGMMAETSWREKFRMVYTAVQARGGCGAMLFDGQGRWIATTAQQAMVEFAAITDLFISWNTGSPLVLFQPESWWWMAALEPSSLPDGRDSLMLEVGVQRSTYLLIARVCDAVSKNVNHVKLGSPGFPGEADLLHALSTYKAQFETEHVPHRVQIGNWTAWHACNIVVQKDLRGVSRRHPDLLASALEIMRLCDEAVSSETAQGLNWTLLAAAAVLEDRAHRFRFRRVLQSFSPYCARDLDALNTLVGAMWERMDQGADELACSWREVMVETGLTSLII